jgi:hypothetical protein
MKAFSMREIQGIIGVRISTKSIRPLSGIVQIDTAATTLQFELNEEIAHELCTHLDRFLTQAQAVRRPQVRRTG